MVPFLVLDEEVFGEIFLVSRGIFVSCLGGLETAIKIEFLGCRNHDDWSPRVHNGWSETLAKDALDKT